MAKPKRIKYVKKLREISYKALLDLPLPKINPNIVSGLSIITSLFFVLALKHKIFAFSLLLITLLLDLLDGLIAKKYKLSSEKGYIIDVTADRLSEGIIFAYFFNPWFHFFTLNCFLAIFSFLKGKHIILPLRQVFAIYFLFRFVL